MLYLTLSLGGYKTSNPSAAPGASTPHSPAGQENLGLSSKLLLQFLGSSSF